MTHPNMCTESFIYPIKDVESRLFIGCKFQRRPNRIFNKTVGRIQEVEAVGYRLYHVFVKNRSRAFIT